MITVILIEPSIEGNIGAIARSMKNFGFGNLVIVNPQCKIGQEAKNRAKHAQDVLKKAKVLKTWPKMDHYIGTTGKLGGDYNIARTPYTPDQLRSALPTKGKIGLVFGRESSGLTNDEIDKCDFLVTIPANKAYPIMNLSHAVTILLYELSKKKDSTTQFTPAGAKEKEQLQKSVNALIDKTPAVNEKRKENQRLIWKKIIGSSFLTKREANTLLGFFRKL